MFVKQNSLICLSDVPQRKIGRDLHTSFSSEQNIIKLFQESGDISVFKAKETSLNWTAMNLGGHQESSFISS